ncbi:MAG: peptidoglycan DD-metalloendopeptidase family protein [Alphaproteobacteria bacterium]|nr:peptidoglycan DD-metalloendopeptidase family protein [Alphaproteobacteria bacterium]
MFGRTRTAMALATMVSAMGMIAGPGGAEAGMRALLVARTGASGDGDGGLAGLRMALRRYGGAGDIKVSTLADPEAMAGAVRAFLSTPNQGDDLRLVWVSGGGYGSPGSVCPPWSEEAVRPAGPSIIVAPACFKVLVQPATPYEHLDAAKPDDDGDDALLSAITPGVAFFSTPDVLGGSVAAVTTALADMLRTRAEASLVTALSCHQPPNGPSLAADFSPSAGAWGLHAACPPAGGSMNVAAVAPPFSKTPAPKTLAPKTLAPKTLAPKTPAPKTLAGAPPPLQTTHSIPVKPPTTSAAPPPSERRSTPLQTARSIPVEPPMTSAAPPPKQDVQHIPAGAGKMRFVSPVDGRVVSAFGSIPTPGGAANKGIDFEASPGAIVKAADGGEVVFVGELPRYGTVVAIKHDNNWATVYGLATNIRVAKGAKVAKNQPFAEIDSNTKLLHFEIRQKGKAIDPRSLLSPIS